MVTSLRWGSAFSAGFLALGCGGTPEVSRDPGGLTGGSGGTGATGGDAGSSASGGKGGTGATGGSGGTVDVGGSAGTDAGTGGDGGTSPVDPCKSKDCDEGQRCESEGDTATCVDNSCDDVDCDDTELCASAMGGGHICIDKCTSDAGCPEDQFCDSASGECVDDECTPDTKTCGTDDTIRVCSSNGAPGTPIACESAGYFESACSEDQASGGACTCEDDWDCPAFMTCDAGVCNGTGVAPTCTLPVLPFSDLLPEPEFTWGGASHSYDDGDETNDDATGKAFPYSAQVVSVPLVINLDDDNGDGVADERDFPEILFISHHESQRDQDGIVRALHGGGPNKGEDFFALCGNPARPGTPAASYSDANGAYWSEGEPVLTECGNAGDVPTNGLARSSGSLAAGDLDGDGFPEIVVALDTKGFQILSNRGEVLFTSPPNLLEPEDTDFFFVSPSPALANLDFAGMPEIIVGNRVVSLKKDDLGNFAIDKLYIATSGGRGTQNKLTPQLFVTGPTVCIADLTDDPGLEIEAGPTVYKLPAAPPAGCGDPLDIADACPLDIVWDATDSLAAAQGDGFCAIADVLGACTDETDCAANPPGPEHPLDGKPEVVLIANGHLVILNGADGTLLRDEGLLGGDWGGAPNVDDFDGDGFPEIATALSDFYRVVDLQAPDATNCAEWPNTLDARTDDLQGNTERTPGGTCTKDSDCKLSGTTCNELARQCVCLHNGWQRDTEDDSSQVTSSSVFDFNGDGAAEVAYGDECYFRVYDGATGKVYLALPSVSRTIVENPVVADVDNDGNAEIVFIQNNWVEQCNEGSMSPGGWEGDVLNDWPGGTVAKDSLPTGITVLGDPTDSWVAARRVWNQHSYHVTNVLESGAIPLHEPESWKPLNGRLYNTYRSQPRNYGVAPDLALTAIQISSPDAMCGVLSDTIEITVVVKNQGDLRVGPGVEVAFYGTWDGTEDTLDDTAHDPIVVTLDKSLEPGASTLVTIEYEVGNNEAHEDALPDSVRVTIDGGNDSDDGKERECAEDNNEVDQDVDAGDALADLLIVVDSAKCSGDVEVTVTNNGADDATDVVVRIYAGDPSSGGKMLAEETIDSLDADASESIELDIRAQDRTVTLWAVVDPEDAIAECNDANNVVEGPKLECSSEPH